MTKEQIKKWIKEAHDDAVERGFYECPECKKFTPDCGEHVIKHCFCDIEKSRGCDCCGDADFETCATCNGTGIDPNKNIGELLMLIVCEIAEAVEAHRCGRFSDVKELEVVINFIKNKSKTGLDVHFKNYIKDTFEDELADVFIRLFDLCGYRPSFKLEYNKDDSYINGKNIAEDMAILCGSILDYDTVFAYTWLLGFCNHHKVDIEKHITAKMAYNRTRPYKHGKEY